MLKASRSVTAFARMIGRSDISTPYMSHRRTPVQNIEYMPRDKSFADFDFQVLITCGKNATVVQNPAASPINVRKSIKYA